MDANMPISAQPKMFKPYFTDESGNIRWGMTSLIWLVVLVGLGWVYIYFRDKSKATSPTTGGGGNGNNGTNNGGNTGNPQNGSDVTPSGYGQWVADYSTNLQRVNNATYWLCWGMNDPNERCEWYDKFLKLSDASQKLVATDFQNRFGKSLASTLPYNACLSCSNGATYTAIKDRLKILGFNVEN